MKDNDTPNRASNMEKAEGDRAEDSKATGTTERNPWRSDPDTIERQDREQVGNGADTESSGTPGR
jgi:hypothetical protein